jgi:hypothetical protein
MVGAMRFAAQKRILRLRVKRAKFAQIDVSSIVQILHNDRRENLKLKSSYRNPVRRKSVR